jgi:hypothetical protein
MNRTGYEQGVARCRGLHTRRYVWRFAIPFGIFALFYYDQALIYPDSYRKGGTPLIPRLAVQIVNGLNDGEPGKHRAISIVIMRPWVTEIRDQAVTELFATCPPKRSTACAAAAR